MFPITLSRKKKLKKNLIINFFLNHRCFLLIKLKKRILILFCDDYVYDVRVNDEETKKKKITTNTH